MEKVTGKRVIAYLIDMIVVAIVASLFSRIPLINPNYEEYNKATDEYLSTMTQNLTDESSIAALEEQAYDLTKLGVYSTIISLTLSVLYYVGFQYLNKGQTLGKKLLKIKLKSDNGEERPKFYQVLIHSVIINSLLTSLLSTLAVILLSKNVYIKVNPIISMIDMLLIFGSLAFMMFRNDGKGLHDILGKTTVVKEDM